MVCYADTSCRFLVCYWKEKCNIHSVNFIVHFLLVVQVVHIISFHHQCDYFQRYLSRVCVCVFFLVSPSNSWTIYTEKKNVFHASFINSTLEKKVERKIGNTMSFMHSSSLTLFFHQIYFIQRDLIPPFSSFAHHRNSILK